MQAWNVKRQTWKSYAVTQYQFRSRKSAKGIRQRISGGARLFINFKYGEPFHVSRLPFYDLASPLTITPKKQVAWKLALCLHTTYLLASITGHYLIRPQFSPLLMRYMVISETPNFSANFLMVIFRFLSLRIFLMPWTCFAFSFKPSVLFACTFL